MARKREVTAHIVSAVWKQRTDRLGLCKKTPELGGVFLSTELAAVRLRAVSRGVRDAVGIVVGELYWRPGLCVYYTDNVPLIVGDVHVDKTNFNISKIFTTFV